MRAAATLALVCLTACGGPAAMASSTFEGDAEGWLLTGNADGTTPTLQKSGGNPGGHLCGQDAANGDIWYFVAPQKYLGNRTQAQGQRLIFDLKQGTIFNQIHGRDVVLNGGGLSLSYTFRRTPSTEWTPFSVPLDDSSGWLREDTNVPATADDLKTTLSNLTALRVRGEFYDGPNDITCLDNVYFGTR